MRHASPPGCDAPRPSKTRMKTRIGPMKGQCLSRVTDRSSQMRAKRPGRLSPWHGAQAAKDERALLEGQVLKPCHGLRWRYAVLVRARRSRPVMRSRHASRVTRHALVAPALGGATVLARVQQRRRFLYKVAEGFGALSGWAYSGLCGHGRPRAGSPSRSSSRGSIRSLRPLAGPSLERTRTEGAALLARCG